MMPEITIKIALTPNGPDVVQEGTGEFKGQTFLLTPPEDHIEKQSWTQAIPPPPEMENSTTEWSMSVPSEEGVVAESTSDKLPPLPAEAL